MDLGWGQESLSLTSMLATEGHTCPEWGHYRTSGSLPRNPLSAPHEGPLQWLSERATGWVEGPRSPQATEQGLGVSHLETSHRFFYEAFFIQDQHKHFFREYLKLVACTILCVSTTVITSPPPIMT